MEALRIFWIWWRDQLLDLVPGHAERRHSRAEDGVILTDAEHRPDDPAAPGSVLVTERRQGIERPVGRIPLQPGATEPIRQAAARNRLPIVLQLPGSLLLERDVTLPISAERDLGRVLFHEMDRFTPFTAAEVVWTHALRLRDRAQGRLVVRLSVVPKTLLHSGLAALGRAGLPAACLELAAADGQRRRIFLDHPEPAGRPPGGLLWPAAGVIAALFALAAALPFLQQSQAQSDLEHRIAAYAPVVDRVRALRQAATASATGADVIAAERKRAGDPLEAIALLTDALPDDTYLTSLDYDAGKLTLDGQSKSAAALIAPLTANQRVQDASFTAPVVRNTLGLDTFSMRLRVTR